MHALCGSCRTCIDSEYNERGVDSAYDEAIALALPHLPNFSLLPEKLVLCSLRLWYVSIERQREKRAEQ